jgi:prophage antirepressor-like protein
MESIKIFQNPAFGQMRVQSTEKGEALFCLNDVRNILSLSHVTELRKRLKEKGCISIAVPTNGGIQQMYFIDEPNLYRCVFQSRKKEAESFQDWVVEEVLPSIRQTGGYVVPGVKLRQASDVYPYRVFSHAKFGEIRTRIYNGEVVFCFVDVWRALGFNNGSLLKQKLNLNTFRYLETPTNSGIQVAGYIDEENLSRCIFRSNSKDVGLFQTWVEKEILTAMRSEPKAMAPEEVEEVKALPEVVPMKLCPELSEIIGGTVILIQQLNRYKTIAGITSENVTMNIAENSLNMVKASLTTLYQEAYIKDLENKLI